MIILWKEFRCPRCGALLMRIKLGTVDVKCKKCGKVTTLERSVIERESQESPK